MKDKIKDHWTKHKTKYFIGGGVVLGAGITWAVMKSPSLLPNSGPLAELPNSTKDLQGSSVHDTLLPQSGASNLLPQSGRGEHALSLFNTGTITDSLNTTVNFGGYPHKIVQNLNTGEIYSTVGEAARSAGVSFTRMSRHINGHMDHVEGAVYRIIGVGTTN